MCNAQSDALQLRCKSGMKGLRILLSVVRRARNRLFCLFAAYQFDRAVVIAMIVMHVVQASVDQVVGMVAVGQRFVAA